EEEAPTGEEEEDDEEEEEDDEDFPTFMMPLRVVSMQYPYGMYMGQAIPDARLGSDIPHGRGSFFYNDGAVYDGDWNRGNWEGQAIRTWPLGARYEGEFENNLQHGQGTLMLPNGGGGYSGEWENGYQHGK
ncbi:unnamed protein product, partial [Ectocarpus fasciculatus]